jgi:hypothetical protein
LTDDGHQTQVITSRWDLTDIEVAYRMFERWRQENFFKYLREEILELIRFAGHLMERVSSGSPNHGKTNQEVHRRVQA